MFLNALIAILKSQRISNSSKQFQSNLIKEFLEFDQYFIFHPTSNSETIQSVKITSKK
jgi:hypothetical protein